MKLTTVVAGAVLAGGLTLPLGTPALAATPTSAAHRTVAVAHQTRSLSRQDVAFLVAAHQGNLAEIAGGYVALAKSHDPEVRHIARQLIVDHRRLDAKAAAVACRHGVRLPHRPSPKQQRELAAVARKSGTAFDLAWLKLQEAGHVQTLALINRELRHGSAADVRRVAAGARPVVAEHLAMVRAALGHRRADQG